MGIQDTIRTLEARHREIARAVEDESERPLPDAMVLQFLKRQRLRIKDEIARLSIVLTRGPAKVSPGD